LTDSTSSNPIMMKAALLLSCVSAEWVRVPGGQWVHDSCMYEAKNGEMLDPPECPHPTYDAAEWEPNDAKDTMLYSPSPQVQCYDQKAYVTAETEFTQMNASFVVPPLPARNVGQTVFLWPGFKATAPIIGRPVLQPVLQDYGSGRWQLQSWGVGIPAGTMTGPKIDVSPGDLITSYMILEGNTWTIYGKNTRTGEESILKLSKTQACRGCKYTSALFVSENVMARNHCDYYPANQGIEFTGVVVNSKPDHNTQWVEKYDCGTPDCGQKVKASADGTSVQLTWNPSQLV